MAMTAVITLAGMLNYKPDLFDEMVLPTPPIDAAAIGLQADQLRSAWTIDKDELAEFIALHTAGMSLVYADGDFMKHILGTWSKAHIHEWQRLFDTLFFRYNPLWNKDGKISETGTDNQFGIENESLNGYANGNNKNTGYTHGYDGGATHEDDGLTWSHAEKSVGTDHADSGSSRNKQHSDTLNKIHTTTEQGNIGVRSSQELIEQERNLALFSIDEFIADAFKKQFCLMLW